MSDLPRFYEGSAGRLDFTALNEMMRRLDLLLPVIETAGLAESRSMFTRPTVFLVKAEKLETSSNYGWREIIVTAGDAVDGDGGGDTGDLEVSFRSGGFPSEDPEDDLPDDYAILADSSVTFEEGFAVCFAVSRADQVKRYLLFPLTSGESVGLPTIFRVGGGGAEESVDFGDGAVTATVYSGTGYRKTEDGWESKDATLYDLSSHEINLPIHNSGASMSYHTMVSGTHLTPTFISESVAYLGTLPRLDFECKGSG